MEERITAGDLRCPVCHAEADPSYLVCPVCTTKLKQACVELRHAARADLAGLPVLRDADRARGAGNAAGARHPTDATRRPAALTWRRAQPHPDQARRRAAPPRRRDPRPDRGARLRDPRGEARHRRAASSGRSTTPSTARSRSSASSSSSSPRARPGRSSSRARARSRRCARRSARPIPRTRRRARSGATSPPRCPTTSCTAPTRRSRRSARSRSGSVADPTVAAWTRRERGVHGRARRAGVGARGDLLGASGTFRRASCMRLPDLEGKDVVELGCGTAYFGAWLKKAGAARVVGVDPDAGAARDRAPLQREVRRGARVRRGVRRGRPAPRRLLRPRRLGVRRLDLGRPVQVDPRGGAAPAARRRARLSPQLDARHPLLARDEDVAAVETLQRPQFGMHRFSWPRRRRRRVPPRARRLDPRSCARTASSSST